MGKEIIITVEMLGEEANSDGAAKMANLMSDLGWNVSAGETSQNTKFDDPDEQEQFDRDWEKCLGRLNANDDRVTLIYVEGKVRVELGKILTNHSMSVDDALNILGIDMETFADKQGWDGWNWECLHLVYAPERDPYYGYEYQCRDDLPCYYDQGVDYQNSSSHMCGPCGQQNCWYSQYVRDYNNVTLIPLAEYAAMHGKAESSARRKAIRGGFTTAKKIGRNWVIDKSEPYTDLRKKPE